MSFQDFFRGLLGLHPRNHGIREEERGGEGVNRFRNPPWGDDPDEDDDFDELFSDYRSPGIFGGGFNVFTGDAMDIHKYFEQQMNEIMRSIGSFANIDIFDSSGSFFGSAGSGINRRMLEGDQPLESGGDPRDRYLKSSAGPGHPRYDYSQAKTDSDIDSRVSSDGLASLFKKDPGDPYLLERRRAVSPHVFSSSSFTSRIIINNNGRVEERVKEKRSDGSEVESVRRKLGDQSHSVITIKARDGVVEQEQRLDNIDPDLLQDFDRKWSSRSQRSTLSPPDEPSDTTPSVFSPLLRLFS